MVLSVAETSTKFPVVNIKAITNSNPILDYQRQLYIKNKIEMNQTTNVHSLFRNSQGNPDSTIREIFAFGIGNTGVLLLIRNTGNFCFWDPEYGKFLFVGSAIREIFACGIRNTGNFCLGDPQYGKFLLVGSGKRETFVCGIRNTGNFCLWDPKSWLWNLYFQLKESGTPLTTGIRNSSFTD